ncbi:hypothetical protein Lal_00016601 [Lupinus albus]|nr:hypothetical protein Lal_00016601 [Lupinus albus]
MVQLVMFGIVLWNILGASCPLNLLLTCLGITQLLVYGRTPPICTDIGGTMVNADCFIPPASSCSEMMTSGAEWCTSPVSLNKPTSRFPVILKSQGTTYFWLIARLQILSK